MKNIALFATALLLGTASAATITGSQTTPLTLKVNNFCQLANLNNGGATPKSFDRTNPAINLGTVNAVTNVVVPAKIVAAVDCNLGTAVKVSTPTKVTMKSSTNAFDITTDAWDAQHPMTMSFSQAGSFTNDIGYGKYDYHQVTASFHLGGNSTLANRAFSIPGGNYTGDLVVTYSYDE